MLLLFCIHPGIFPVLSIISGVLVSFSESLPGGQHRAHGRDSGKDDHSFLMPLPVALGVAAINQAIKEGKAAQTERVLRNPAVALRGVVPNLAGGYQRVLENAMAKKRRAGNGLSLTSSSLPAQPPVASTDPSLLTWLLLRGHSFLGST